MKAWMTRPSRKTRWSVIQKNNFMIQSSRQALLVLFAVTLLLVVTGVCGQTRESSPKPESIPVAHTGEVSAEPGKSTADEGAGENQPAEDPAQEKVDRDFRGKVMIASLTIFVLAIFVGFEIITKVPPTLHTPLMSGSNAISGITLVGAVIVAGHASGAPWLGMVAVSLATVNVIGGFLVTHRMLSMFIKRH